MYFGNVSNKQISHTSGAPDANIWRWLFWR
jgi:hypothetical protein